MIKFRHGVAGLMMMAAGIWTPESLASGSDTLGEQGVLKVRVENIKDNQGQVLVALYGDDESWMEDAKAVAKQAKPAQKGVVEFEFRNLKNGSYGFAIIHDANQNNELDMQWLPPKPKEGVATSNNAQGRFGPPDWGDAKFFYQGGQIAQTVSMVYM